MPSSAFAGRPSASLIESGSAKNARYISEGASTASSGSGHGRSHSKWRRNRSGASRKDRLSCTTSVSSNAASVIPSSESS